MMMARPCCFLPRCSQVSEFLLNEYTHMNNKPQLDFSDIHGEYVPRISLKSTVNGLIFAMRLSAKSDAPKGTADEADVETANLKERRSAIFPGACDREHEEDAASLLQKSDSWDFNIFELRDLTGGKELQCLAWHVFDKWELTDKFDIDSETLRRFLNFAADGYEQNSYHNRTHAADILQGTNFMLSEGGLGEFLSDVDKLSLIIAALAHDIGHDGFSNNYHKNAMTERAVRFNDQSIQENWHASLLFTQIFENSDINILSSCSEKTLAHIRSNIIYLILQTDMSKHFSLTDEVKNMTEENVSRHLHRLLNSFAATCLCFLSPLIDCIGPRRFDF